MFELKFGTLSQVSLSLNSTSASFLFDDLGNSSDDNPPLFDPRGQTQTLFKVQLYVCSILGLVCFFMFCFVRHKFPLIFSIRSYRNKKIKALPNDMFSWIKILVSINNDQLLQVIGLESYVFLCFFRMGIKILLSLSILGLCILSPARYFLTGSFDKDNTNFKFLVQYISILKGDGDGDDSNNDSEPLVYLALCTIFTYIFTAVIYYFLFKETNHIIKTRQKFLGSQRSLTDRTIFIKNIPSYMCNENDLKKHIHDLQVGQVDEINFVYDYSPLVKLYGERNKLINKLEILYSKSCGLDISLFKSLDIQSVHLNTIKANSIPTVDCVIYDSDSLNKNLTDTNYNENLNADTESYYILSNVYNKKYLKKKRYCFMVKPSDKELIDFYSRKLLEVNSEISHLKESYEFKRTSLAFVTMDSVTDAQMAAQAVFSPKVFELITELAPAPLDIDWNNLLLDNKALFLRKNVIEFIIIMFSILLIIPIRYITSLLNVNAIRRMWKEFGDYLIKHEKVRTVVTGLLPTYLFSIINTILPYVISILSNLQGLGSKGDVELSVIKKNFLYIFFNLFLVFTLFGTLSSYKALLTDTTKIAPLLATSIKSLSLFYIDLILLQGLTMFPFKLLQIGDLSLLVWNFIINFKNRTPRLFNEALYKPPIFDLGLILPQHILIFIITILYSSISTKILVSGLVYFVLGFYTYKYQLVYSLVHPYHSTGKAWPIIFKRICLGIFFLHLQMFGSLALEHSFILAGLMLPLFPSTVVALMFFDRNYKPLLHYIALDAIKTHGKSVGPTSEIDGFDSLLMSTGLNNDNENIHRKESFVSLKGFLNGSEDCDAVLINSSRDTLPHSDEINENVFLSDNNDTDSNDIDSTNRGATSDDKLKSILINETQEPEIKNGSNVTFHNNDSITGITNSTTINDTVNCNSTSLNNINETSLLDTSSTCMRRKCSTIEEEREATQSYVHPCLLDELDGLIVGFTNDDIDYLDFRIVENQNLGNVDYDIDGGAVSITTNNVADGSSHEDISNANIDIEAPKGIIVGSITRKHQNDMVW